MIATEYVKKFKSKDIIAIMSLAMILLALNFLIETIPAVNWRFTAMLFITALILSINVLLIKKAFSATFFMSLIGASLYLIRPEFIIPEMFAFILAGVIFDIIFLVLRLDLLK